MTALPALVLGAGGVASGLAVWVQGGGEGAGSVAPVASGSAAAIAVSAIVWVLKKNFAGDIVAKPIAEYHRELGVILAAMADREAVLMKTIEEQRRRAERSDRILEENGRVLWLVNEKIGGPDPRRTRRK